MFVCFSCRHELAIAVCARCGAPVCVHCLAWLEDEDEDDICEDCKTWGSAFTEQQLADIAAAKPNARAWALVGVKVRQAKRSLAM
jgi:hypothetical protein